MNMPILNYIILFLHNLYLFRDSPYYCSPVEVQKKLQEYQNFIMKKFGKEYVTDDQDLTLLSIKSLEVIRLLYFLEFRM